MVFSREQFKRTFNTALASPIYIKIFAGENLDYGDMDGVKINELR